MRKFLASLFLTVSLMFGSLGSSTPAHAQSCYGASGRFDGGYGWTGGYAYVTYQYTYRCVIRAVAVCMSTYTGAQWHVIGAWVGQGQVSWAGCSHYGNAVVIGAWHNLGLTS